MNILQGEKKYTKLFLVLLAAYLVLAGALY